MIHVGYPRTGTTFLQRQFFPHLPGCTFITRGGPFGNAHYRQLSANLTIAEPEDYLESTLRGFLADTMRAGAGPLVISDEGLSGSPWHPRSAAERNAERLHDLLPAARILVCIRNQATMLPSLYGLYVQKGGGGELADFLHGRTAGRRLVLDHLCYDTLVDVFRQRFGSDRVEVLPYERLVAEPATFLADVAACIGVTASGAPADLGTENRSLSPPSNWLLRHSNRLFRRSHLNPPPSVGDLRAAHRLRSFLQDVVDPAVFRGTRGRLRPRDQELIARLVPRYADSNARLEKLTGLSLRELGYPLPPRLRVGEELRHA